MFIDCSYNDTSRGILRWYMFTYPLYIAFGLLASINIIAFIVMAIDKQRSRQRGDIDRIPEVIVFFLATAFGAIGIYTAILLLRHKTRKWYFQIGIPLLIMQNAATVYLAWYLIF